MIINVFLHIKKASILFFTKPNLNNRPMNIQFCIDHNDVPFFQYRDLFPRSTKVLLGYVVMYVKSSFEPSVTLVLGGGGHSFLQIYTDFVPKWLNIIEWHIQLKVSFDHKYQRLCFPSSSKILVIIMVTISTQLVLKNTTPFISVPSQQLAFSVSFILFSVKPT